MLCETAKPIILRLKRQEKEQPPDRTYSALQRFLDRELKHHLTSSSQFEWASLTGWYASPPIRSDYRMRMRQAWLSSRAD
jgi:hypothetical protein